MRVYLDPGKLGFYHKVLEPFEWEKMNKLLDPILGVELGWLWSVEIT
jgi:hypothetical protein